MARNSLNIALLTMVSSGVFYAAHAVADDSVRFAAIAVGVSPESLAASGCDAATANAILQSLTAAAGLRLQYEQYLTTCDASNANASGYADLLTDASSDYQDREDVIAESELAEEAFQDSIDDAKVRRDALLAVAMYAAPAGIQAKIQAFTAAAIYEVPDEFRVLTQTANEWEALEVAVRAEAKATRKGTTLDSVFKDLLDDTRAEPDVIAAKAGLDANYDAMVTVFESY